MRLPLADGNTTRFRLPVTAPPATVVASNTVTIGGTPSATARPTAVDDHEITASVMGSGHAAMAADNAGAGILSGHTVTVMESAPLASLFQDPDSSRLSFTADGDAATGLQSGVTFPAAAMCLAMRRASWCFNRAAGS